MDVQKILVVMIVTGFFFQYEVLSFQNMMCNPNDFQALQDIMNDMDSVIDGWANELSSDCCKWPGVTCNSSSSLGLNSSIDTYRVVKLELPNKKLLGKISESLGNLEMLKTLNLSRNFLMHSLPFNLFQLPNLELLDLSCNYFSGPFPVHIYLPSIQFLDMSQNFLNGSIPISICGNSTQLRVLKLDGNYFSGNLPPGLDNCSSLEAIHLSKNSLSGGIPEGIFQLQKLTQLNIQNNQLSGELSKDIRNLNNLVHLDISTNWFSGTIPDVFLNLKRLQYFLSHSNNFSGRIPSSLSSSPSISLLSVRNNSLQGNIHLNCSAMTSLVSLDLGSNRFDGPIPSNLPSCLHLNSINFARNKLSGQIPESFKKFRSLSYLSLSNSSFTNLSSALQILSHCKNLTFLVLTMNFYDEELPADPTLYFPSLKVLILPACRLTGSIPQWLSNSSKLQLLDLSWNRLEGTIPLWFGDFMHLFFLDLSNNSFTGNIPRSITGLHSLIYGNISVEAPSIDLLLFMGKGHSGTGLQYNQVWRLPPTLDFSNNNLSGPVWPEFGDLKSLNVLNLGFNSLSGPIPSTLSGMTSIENLNLSHNKLSGTIPPSLVNLSFLSKFSVADNQLEGMIPTGGQFMTFPNASFQGNNLCGFHASSCPSNSKPKVDEGQPTPRKSSLELEAKGVYIGVAVGFVLGVACFIGTGRYI